MLNLFLSRTLLNFFLLCSIFDSVLQRLCEKICGALRPNSFRSIFSYRILSTFARRDVKRVRDENADLTGNFESFLARDQTAEIRSRKDTGYPSKIPLFRNNNNDDDTR